MLENCQNHISVYGCSLIQGTKFYFYLNLMKPGSQSGTKLITRLFIEQPLASPGLLIKLFPTGGEDVDTPSLPPPPPSCSQP